MSQTNYRKQMDELHVPQEKANETLRLMLEENRRLREREQKKPALVRRIPVYAAAAIACLAIAVVGIRQFGAKTVFQTVRISDLPSVGGENTSSSYTRPMMAPAFVPDEKDPFSAFIDMDPSEQFPGWTAELADSSEHLIDGEWKNDATLTLTRGNQQMTAVISEYRPPLWTALNKADGSAPCFAKDSDTGTLYAIAPRGELWVVFSSDSMTEADFSAAVKKAAGS